MTINSKQKGSRLERQVAKLLSEWSGYDFHRTPMSGALHWTNDKRVLSDIVPPQALENYPFSMECKNVEYDYDFTYLMSGTSMFYKHWKQATDDAQRECLRPMLIFTKNRRDIYTAFRIEDFKKFDTEFSTTVCVEYKGEKIVILLFKELLEKVNLEKFLSAFSK